MIRSDTHKFIFLRVPKNASSSLAQWLIKNYTKSQDVYTEVNDGGIPFQGDAAKLKSKYSKDSHFIHMKLQELYDEGIVTQEHLDSYETIAVIRNPFERQLSLHFFLSRIQKYQPSPQRFREDFKTGCHQTDTNNQILQSEYATVHGIDYASWWVYDNLNAHVKSFEKKHGAANTPLGNLKAGITNYDLMEQYYDQKTRDAIRKYYESDFELYENLKNV